ncbi:hydroxypyruvate isomerase [Klebsiella pneumoniae]|nr:hydroxypyruvate isomerase [Klebsiella pneumoniae]
MPKFAANLSMLFTELPFLERFAAAARAGFEAVEFLFPYEYAAGEIRQRLQENQLQLVLFNTPPGDVNAGEWGLAAAVLIDNLRYAAECFARHDKRILIEALNPQTKPGYLYHSQYQTLAMVKRVDRPNLAVQLDLFHAQKVDGNLSHLITEYAGQYRHIQIASLPDRHEPDEGEINYPWLYALLDKTGYDGWIGCEYIPRTDTLSGLGWFSPYRKK